MGNSARRYFACGDAHTQKVQAGFSSRRQFGWLSCLNHIADFLSVLLSSLKGRTKFKSKIINRQVLNVDIRNSGRFNYSVTLV